MLESAETIEFLLTHALIPAGPIPTVHDPDGIYPYESFCETSRRPEIRRYRMVTIENDQIRVKICPDLGGRVCSLWLKEAAIEALFLPSVIRPVRILPRQAFTGGGIELSFPISHSPVQIVPVLHDVSHSKDRIYVSCGERELRFGMQWTVEYSLGVQDSFLTQRTVFFNPDREAHPWMSWSNAAVPAQSDTLFDFPSGPVLVHDSHIRDIDWKREGPRGQADVQRMTGYFWRSPDCCAFGAFTPSRGAGLYHVADPLQVPGIKLWSDGVGCDEAWVSQYTLDGKQCLEIQAGPLLDQSMKDTLDPGQLHQHVEFWIPSDRRMEIRNIPLPTPGLRQVKDVPLFTWARDEDVIGWLQVISAHIEGDVCRIPKVPGMDSNRWAPSGMVELGDALSWVASLTEEGERDKWLFHRGAWLAARGELDAALKVLSQSRDDRGRALSGRLWLVCKHDARAAAEAFRAIESSVISLHPQVVIERDRALAALGSETIEERARWLNAVAALDDEWLIERRAALLLDRDDAHEALQVLMGARFQLVHQRYERTMLWRRAESMLDMKPEEHPSWLGEDDLAEFGAYRESSGDPANQVALPRAEHQADPTT